MQLYWIQLYLTILLWPFMKQLTQVNKMWVVSSGHLKPIGIAMLVLLPFCIVVLFERVMQRSAADFLGQHRQENTY